jgi:type IV pilus assembly protein PilQ
MKSFMLALLLMMAVCNFAEAGQIQSMQVKTVANESVIEIIGNGIGDYVKEEKASPPQLVLTFKDSTVADIARQTFDPSTETPNSPLVQVSSYPYTDLDARVVLDFKSKLQYKIDASDRKITIRIPLANDKPAVAVQRERMPELKASDLDPLTTIMSAGTDQKFTGSPITLKLKDADVHEVLRLISDASGFNIVIHPQVNGRLTLSLEQVPWDQALDVVLTTLRLAAERKDSVLRVMPRDQLINEKQAEIDAKRVVAQAAPRITRIFPVSYAELGPLQSLLTTFANSQSTAGGTPATILTNANTQSLIVRDTAEGVDRIKKMIQLLDVQTPQVIIETKVIDALESFSKTIGGRLSMSLTSDNRNRMDFNGGVPAATGAPTSSTGNSNSFRFGIGNSATLDALLAFSETQNTAKVVSSPRVMVLSGRRAQITQGSNIVNSVSTVTPTGTQITQNFIPYNTSLGVTPRVTNDGSVFLNLNLTRDTVETISGTSVTAPRSINTEVIVESGNTLVLGGVHSVDETSNEGGFPILRKMPIIGWLFGEAGGNTKKTELVFFVTPRIVNQEKNLGKDQAVGDASGAVEGEKETGKL